MKRQETCYENDRHRACHQSFKTSNYEHFKDNNPDRVPKTCRWVLQNAKYSQWWQAEKDDLLWISADPGCGKSVLARSLIEYELRSTATHTTCYFFFKDNEEQDSLATALCALLHQLFSRQPWLLRYAMDSWDKNNRTLKFEVQELWRILLSAATSEDAHPITIIIDALDECQEKDRHILIGMLSEFYNASSSQRSRSSSLKILMTSRPYIEIEDEFRQNGTKLRLIRLRGEMENDKIHEEINLVVSLRVAAFAKKNKLRQSTKEKLEQKLLAMKHRTYLWLHLAIKDIENTFSTSLRPDSESIDSLLLPSSVEEAYEKILRRIPEGEKEVATQIFSIIVSARRPLTTGEMAMALGILRRKDGQSFTEFKIAETRLREKIRDLCGLFVFISHSKVYLLHQTAKEFLLLQEKSKEVRSLWRYSLDLGKCETKMASICVEYLLLDELYHISKCRAGDKRTPSELNDEKMIRVLLPYSSEHWADHFRNASFELKDEVTSRARELCLVESVQWQLWFPHFWSAFQPYINQPYIDDVGLVSLNGHDQILRLILDVELFDLRSQDEHGQRALLWAEIGHQKVVQTLLTKGVKVNAQGGFYGNALQAASVEGYKKVVQILLTKDAKVNA